MALSFQTSVDQQNTVVLLKVSVLSETKHTSWILRLHEGDSACSWKNAITSMSWDRHLVWWLSPPWDASIFPRTPGLSLSYSTSNPFQSCWCAPWEAANDSWSTWDCHPCGSPGLGCRLLAWPAPAFAVVAVGGRRKSLSVSLCLWNQTKCWAYFMQKMEIKE